jgi:hypothetical protein
MSAPIEKIIERLWNRMTGIYGKRWLAEYGPALDEAGKLAALSTVWGDALYDAPHEKIGRGINACMKRESPYLPSLPEFLRLCGHSHSTETHHCQEHGDVAPMRSHVVNHSAVA